MHEPDFPLAAQMTIHILAMNIAAPMLVLLLDHLRRLPRRTFGGLALATVAQLVAIWSAHAPGMLEAMHAELPWMLMLHGALFLVALWFWHAVVLTAGDRRWHAVLALLITAKLFCLLGALLVFAPQPLSASLGVDDQQTAGLLMLVACPITYLFAAGLIAARWLLDVEARPARP